MEYILYNKFNLVKNVREMTYLIQTSHKNSLDIQGNLTKITVIQVVFESQDTICVMKVTTKLVHACIYDL